MCVRYMVFPFSGQNCPLISTLFGQNNHKEIENLCEVGDFNQEIYLLILFAVLPKMTSNSRGMDTLANVISFHS